MTPSTIKDCRAPALRLIFFRNSMTQGIEHMKLLNKNGFEAQLKRVTALFIVTVFAEMVVWDCNGGGIEVTATVQDQTPVITLHFSGGYPSYKVYRRPALASDWSEISPAGGTTATDFPDNSASVGTAYEYFV